MFYFRTKYKGLKDDILSGLTVSLALVPEAIAFALIADLNPLVGLYAAFMVGLIASIFGGRPGMISGATGALAVVMVSLVAEHGVQYLFATVILMGALQLLFGFLKFGRFIKMVPYPVMLGFVNGLAIVIFIAQMVHFKVKLPTEEVAWMSGMPLALMVGLVLLTMVICKGLPYITRAIPSSLAAILVVTGLVHGLHLDVTTVKDLASISGGLPTFNLPNVPFNFNTLAIIFPYAGILALVGLIESLLTLQLIDDITETKGQPNRECVGQGLANLVTGFFGGMGGCAMIGQSMININSGGLGRWSGISASLFLLSYILVGSALIECIPVAALVGVMFMVVLGTFEWSSFRILSKIPRADAFVLVLVSTVTVFTDLALAVIIGVILSALVYAWKTASHMKAHKFTNEQGAQVYELHGPLFFGSIQSFQQLFSPQTDPAHTILDFKQSKVYDHSGLEAIEALTERYKKYGKQLQLVNLSEECIGLLAKVTSAHNLDTKEQLEAKSG